MCGTEGKLRSTSRRVSFADSSIDRIRVYAIGSLFAPPMLVKRTNIHTHTKKMKERHARLLLLCLTSPAWPNGVRSFLVAQQQRQRRPSQLKHHPRLSSRGHAILTIKKHVVNSHRYQAHLHYSQTQRALSPCRLSTPKRSPKKSQKVSPNTHPQTQLTSNTDARPGRLNKKKYWGHE